MSLESKKSARRLIILGSTGSIGVNTLKVVEHLNHTGQAAIHVVGLAAGRQADLLIAQAKRFNVPALAIADTDIAKKVHAALPKIQLFTGPQAALQLVESSNATDLSAAIVGSAGLAATAAGIRKGMRIGLANKETLVAAGAWITPLVRAHNAMLIPVDSEHSAIFQCLVGQSSAGLSSDGTLDTRWVKRIVLTASGGPFRQTSKEEMMNATVEQALNHPTWKMGPKITIDSASMMNKALEIIEAHWLFNLPGSKIGVIIHPQSVAHSFVEFLDNSVMAQLGPPDMKTPIQYALTFPDRPTGSSDAMDWSKLSKLEFQTLDMDKFAAVRLAYDVIEAGGTAGAVFNAANESAVAAFLERRIRFGRIVELVADALSAIGIQPASDLPTIMEADRQARQWVEQRLAANVA